MNPFLLEVWDWVWKGALGLIFLVGLATIISFVIAVFQGKVQPPGGPPPPLRPQ